MCSRTVRSEKRLQPCAGREGVATKVWEQAELRPRGERASSSFVGSDQDSRAAGGPRARRRTGRRTKERGGASGQSKISQRAEFWESKRARGALIMIQQEGAIDKPRGGGLEKGRKIGIKQTDS
jgi:hypothetical protein